MKTTAPDMVREAVFASENLMAVTGPCGHSVPIENAIEARDAYYCPVCGIRYRIETDPPKIYPSGFVMPGDRHVVIQHQTALPMAIRVHPCSSVVEK